MKTKIELCPVCTVPMDPSLRDIPNDQYIAHDIHWSKDMCPECEEMRQKGFILIGAVEAKTKDATNPYRSGNVWCVTQEVAEQLFAPHGAPPSGVAFVDVTVAKQMDLPGVNLDA